MNIVSKTPKSRFLTYECVNFEWLNGRQDAGVKLEVIEEKCIEVKLEEGIIGGGECEEDNG